MNTPKTPLPDDLVVGKRIATLRKARGLSQSALGEKLGVSYQQVAKYEAGTNRVSFGRMVQIATALDVSFEELRAAPPAESHEAAMEEPGVRALVAAYTALGAERRGLVLALVEGMAKSHPG